MLPVQAGLDAIRIDANAAAAALAEAQVGCTPTILPSLIVLQLMTPALYILQA